MAPTVLMPALSSGPSSDVATSTARVAVVPDSASVHVLYAGNLADDDFMWIVECTVEEFQKMLGAPTQWVHNLATLPDWPYASVQVAKTSVGTAKASPLQMLSARAATPRQPALAPVLLDHFTMRVVSREKDSGSGLITIQGISHTGIVTVRTSRASAVEGVRNLQSFRDRSGYALDLHEGEAMNSASAAFDSFWDELSYDPNNAPSYKKELAVNVDTSDDQYYAHFEIAPPGELTSEELLARAAAFVLAYGSDPQGFTAMLNSLDQTTLYITPNGAVPGAPITLDMTSDTPPTLLYTNPGDTGEACCSMLDGSYDSENGTGVVDNPVVKRYGIG